MTSLDATSTTLISQEPPGRSFDEEEMATASFLARYNGRTLEAYRDGLRVAEACETNVEDLGFERGHRTLKILGKGNKPATIPLVPRTARTIDLADRRRQNFDRHAAYVVVAFVASG